MKKNQMRKKKNKLFSFVLDTTRKLEIEYIAKLFNRSLGEVIRDAIDSYYEHIRSQEEFFEEEEKYK